MNEQPEQITDEQIHDLLRRPELRDGAAKQFAAAHLYAYHDEAWKAAEWQRTEGRTRVLAGEDPDVIRDETLARIDAARRVLHAKLQSLLAWAEKGDQPPDSSASSSGSGQPQSD